MESEYKQQNNDLIFSHCFDVNCFFGINVGSL